MQFARFWLGGGFGGGLGDGFSHRIFNHGRFSCRLGHCGLRCFFNRDCFGFNCLGCIFNGCFVLRQCWSGQT